MTALLFCYAPPVFAQDEWWDANWLYRVKIQIDNSSVGESLTSFPLLVCFDGNDIDYSHTEDDGSDIRFVDAGASPGALPLPHEIEEWNEAGTSFVWVKVDIAPTSADEYIWIYYGNPSPPAAPNPEEVWDSNFVGVWHLTETGTGAVDDYEDSTGNGNHGQGETDTATANLPSPVTGKINGAQDFENTSPPDSHYAYIDITNEAEFDDQTEITVELWYYHETWSAPGQNSGGFISKGDLSWKIRQIGATNSAEFRVQIGASSYAAQSNVNLTTGGWHQLVGTYDYVSGTSASTIALYTDGGTSAGGHTASSSATGQLNTAGDDDHVWIGSNYDYPQRTIDGRLDEVRISNIPRSAEWIEASYLCMNSCDFTTFGQEEIAFTHIFTDDQQGTTLMINPDTGKFWFYCHGACNGRPNSYISQRC
jgi:hypothetical protein